MKIKELEIPVIVHKLQALSERMKDSSSKLPHVKSDLSKFLSGYNGEKSLEFHLTFLQDDLYHILHDVRLHDGERFFQIDVLIISPFFAVIAEVKNLSGHITFDGKFNQLIQTKNGQERAFPDPLLQVQRQITQFRAWLKKSSLPQVPLHGMIVMSNPYSVLTSTDYEADNLIVKPPSLVSSIDTIKKQYDKPFISQKELKKLTKQILIQHELDERPILDRYGLEITDIINGVFCPECKSFPMRRIYKYWTCPRCSCRSTSAHLSALKDYYLLFGKTITSKQLREFLMIDSYQLATRLLQSTPHLTKSGHYKSTIYTISEQINL
ncbi:nuclease-related domain-containing protein [Rossellomorea marisflavi]|uniref:nuclease-related domain-containing protein n=1 Tax=Rossellomorea marisflavi TaxID=189381 RepID=UPI001EE34D96|nr:nuclease-related domain-containing protein [Rossellomorea marisflavi]UKS65335.1 NERD domain-containing protein [Rossellomorea marisflavi]